jgi:beta-lactamase regulating signal transducer with metallopeptidase domain
MFVFFNGNFLQALGYGLVHTIWQVAILWIIYYAINFCFHCKASIKYWIAVSIQLVGFFWFMATVYFYFKEFSQLYNPTNFDTIGVFSTWLPENNYSYTNYALHILNKAESLIPYLSLAYLFILPLIVFRWTTMYYKTQQLRNTGIGKINIDARLFVKTTSWQLGIKKEVTIFMSNYVTTPITIGFLKPLILVPIACINNLSTTQLEAILLHELAHISRKDYLINLLLSVLETVLFFNPFVQLLSKQIANERENACDDLVLQFKYQPAIYAEALLQIAYLQTVPAIAMAASKSKPELLQRVRRMVNKNYSSTNYRNQLLLLLLLSILFISTTFLFPFNQLSNKKKLASVATNNNYVAEPMAAKVNNPLFNPLFFFQKNLQKEIQLNIETATKELNASTKENRRLTATITIPAATSTLESLAISSSEKISTKEPTSFFIVDTFHTSNEIAVIENKEKIGNELKKIGASFEKKIQLFEQSITSKKWLSSIINELQQFKKVEENFKFQNLAKNSKKIITETVTKQLVKVKFMADSLKQIKFNQQQFLIAQQKVLEINRNYWSNIYSKETLPFSYAIQNTTAETPIVETSLIEDEKITVIKIKAKNKPTDSLGNNVVKRYVVEVANQGEKNKTIIIEVY